MSTNNQKFKYAVVAFAAGLAIAATTPSRAFGGEAMIVAAITALQSAMNAVISRMGSGLMDKVVKGAEDAVKGTLKGTTDLSSILSQGNRVNQQVASETAARTQETIIRTAHGNNLLATEARFQETNPCSVSAPAGGMQDAQRLATAPVASQAPIAGRSGGAGGGRPFAFSGSSPAGKAMAQVLNVAENRGGGGPGGSASAVKPPPEAIASLAAAGACGTFVTSGSPRGNVCNAAGLSPANASGFLNADINAQTLVSGPLRDGAPPTMSFNFDPDSNEHKAFAAYRRNLFATFEQRDLAPAEARTDAGRRFIAMRDAFNARMSMAEFPSVMHQGSITARRETIPALRALMDAQGDPAFMQRYLQQAKPDWTSRGVSSDELLNIEVQRRYMNPDWLNRTVSMAAEPRAAEQLRVQALTNVLLFELRREVRMQNLLVGAQMANGIRNEAAPELRQALQQAAR